MLTIQEEEGDIIIYNISKWFPCAYSLIVRQGSPEGQSGLGEWGVT